MNVTSATTMAPPAPLYGIAFPGPGGQPEVGVSRSVVKLPAAGAPAPDAAPEPVAAPESSKAWVAWFDLNGDGVIQNYPVSEGGDAYMPGAIDVGPRSVPVDGERSAPVLRLDVPGDPDDGPSEAPDASLVGARLQRAAETYRRDGGSGREPEAGAITDRLNRLVDAIEREVEPQASTATRETVREPDHTTASRPASSAV